MGISYYLFHISLKINTPSTVPISQDQNTYTPR